MPVIAGDVVHHLYKCPGDLLPACGVVPRPDEATGDWHTGHDLQLLLECVQLGLPACVTCLSPEVLGGFTPLISNDTE